MKQRLPFSIAVITAATVFFLKANEGSKEENNDLVLANVEALATNENETNEYMCYGIGNIVCPDTGKLVLGYYKKRNLE